MEQDLARHAAAMAPRDQQDPVRNSRARERHPADAMLAPLAARGGLPEPDDGL